MRLDKYLAHAKIGTRKEVKKIIRKGYVSVNEIIIKNDDYQIDAEIDKIQIGDEIINYQEYYYIMLNKPSGYISSNIDEMYPSVLNLINEYFAFDLQIVGRLDVDTTGLLLLTNDGKLNHNLLSPKKHVDKTYEVKLKNKCDDKFIEILENEIIFNDIKYKAGKVQKIDDYNILLTISEGKFHQVKNMVNFAENEVVSLNRISIGNLNLDNDLKLGDYRFLTNEEIKLLKEED